MLRHEVDVGKEVVSCERQEGNRRPAAADSLVRPVAKALGAAMEMCKMQSRV